MMAYPRRRLPVQKALPIEQWPRADRKAWKAAQAGGGPLDDGGLASHLSVRTREDLTKRYAYYLHFLASRGVLSYESPAAASVTPENIVGYADFLQSRLSTVTLAQSIYKVARVTKCIAPERDWSWLKGVVRKLDARAKPRDKRADVVEITELRELGLKLMESAEIDQEKSPMARALLHRDGLIIALLATDPLRLNNIRHLQIGRTIVKDGATWSIVICPDDMKNRNAHIALLPDWITPHIDRHVEAYRPLFPNADRCVAVWMSRQGNPLSESGFARVTINRTQAALGKAINPHLFRDCLATSTAVHHGAHMGLAITVLGQRDQRVNQKYYNQANMISAVTVYQSMLLEADAPEETAL